MRDKEPLVTIARYETGFDAEVAKMALDNEGIACFLAGMDLVVNMPYPNVIAVELQVFQSDARRATEVLSRIVPLEGEPADDEPSGDA